jgi:hypothetical protein
MYGFIRVAAPLSKLAMRSIHEGITIEDEYAKEFHCLCWPLVSDSG